MFCLSCICGRLFTSDAQLKKNVNSKFYYYYFFFVFCFMIDFLNFVKLNANIYGD